MFANVIDYPQTYYARRAAVDRVLIAHPVLNRSDFVLPGTLGGSGDELHSADASGSKI